MTKIFLVAFLFVNGQWVPGEYFDGWAPVELEPGTTLEHCESRLPEINMIDPRLLFDCIEVHDGN